MRKILVINAKGGCGKSTISTNLASFYASQGYQTALFDHDPQGSSMQWLQRRPEPSPSIYGVASYEQGSATTRAWRLRIPAEIERVVIDTPAGLKGYELKPYLAGVNTILVPILPSSIDINASANFLRELLLVAKVNTQSTPIYFVPNRVRFNTQAMQNLRRFLSNLGIAITPHLRDTVNYAMAAELGTGIHELPSPKTNRDRETWRILVSKIDHQFAELIQHETQLFKISN